MKLIERIRQSTYRQRICAAGIAAALIAALIAGNEIIVVSEYIFYNEKIPEGFEDFRIVQISDYHNKQTGLDYLVRKVAEQKPDIIVITGDIVDSSRTDISRAMEMSGEIVKISPVYYITGNHEGRLKEELRDTLFKGLENLGVVRLQNAETRLIAENGDEITLIGIDGRSPSSTLVDIVKETDGLRVALCHYPEDADIYRESGVELVLTGHAHGGQVRIPLTDIGLISPGEGFFPKYTAGMHILGDTVMEVNRGIGNSSIPVRIFNPPEITVITLTSKE